MREDSKGREGIGKRGNTGSKRTKADRKNQPLPDLSPFNKFEYNINKCHNGGVGVGKGQKGGEGKGRVRA